MGILQNYPPYSQPADSLVPDNHGGLEGFEVRCGGGWGRGTCAWVRTRRAGCCRALLPLSVGVGTRCGSAASAPRARLAAPPQVDLTEALCAAARLNCTVLPMRSFDERLAALTSTTVDVLVSGLSYSEERAQHVHFLQCVGVGVAEGCRAPLPSGRCRGVRAGSRGRQLSRADRRSLSLLSPSFRPYYYSAGVVLYSDSAEGSALAESLKGGWRWGGRRRGAQLALGACWPALCVQQQDAAAGMRSCAFAERQLDMHGPTVACAAPTHPAGGNGFPDGTKLCIQEGFYVQSDLERVRLHLCMRRWFCGPAAAAAQCVWRTSAAGANWWAQQPVEEDVRCSRSPPKATPSPAGPQDLPGVELIAIPSSSLRKAAEAVEQGAPGAAAARLPQPVL